MCSARRGSVSYDRPMKLGLIADVHGNLAALRAVLVDAEAIGVDRWWALGDLVLFGSRPVEVLEALAGLPNVEYVSGNTDRYVLTGQQPSPHATAADAVGDLDLVERYGAMSGAIGWTRGALAQSGTLDAVAGWPAQQLVELPGGSQLLGVHASPGRDDGPGIDNGATDGQLSDLVANCGARTIVGGHTHDPTDRVVGPVRALNPGSVGLPRRPGYASWMRLDAGSDGIDVQHREVAFDVDGVVSDLHRRGYPNAPFLELVLTGRHPW
jgi:putative phosphoesterase